VTAAAEMSAQTQHIAQPRPAASASAYIGSFDVLRVIAALAVVWIHTMEFGALDSQVFWARFAVPSFTVISIFLLGMSSTRKDISAVSRDAVKRAWSVYRLFLIWNGIYLIARATKHSVLHQGQSIHWCFSAAAIAGFVGQLWYLPFIALCSLLLVLPLRWFIGLTGARAFSVSIALLLASYGVNVAAAHMPVDYAHYPWTYFVFLSLATLPAALLVFPVAWLFNRRADLFSKMEIGVAFPIVAVALLFASSKLSSTANLLHNVAALFLVMGSLPWMPYFANSNVWRRAGELALPVYLIHILVLDFLRAGAHGLHLNESAALEIGLFLLTVMASFLTAALLSSKAQLAWLISVRAQRESARKAPKLL